MYTGRYDNQRSLKGKLYEWEAIKSNAMAVAGFGWDIPKDYLPASLTISIWQG
jgi:hypothetical protein